MADVESGASGSGRRKRARVDMTAMVDVAFLLLTFFVLTTTLREPKGIRLVTPDTVTEPKKVVDDKILTFILGENDQVYYYHGMLAENSLKTTGFGEEGLRKLVAEHLKRSKLPCGDGRNGDCWDPIFVLKPHSSCRYKNVVDALDELRLAEAPKYSYGELNDAELLSLRAQNLK